MRPLDVERPCYPTTTHRYRRVGQLDILCCVRCGQGKQDIVGVALAALDEERLARALQAISIPETYEAWRAAVDRTYRDDAADIAKAYREDTDAR